MLLHYRLVEEIGKGGMGVVYRAYDTKLRRPAAVKVLKPELLHDEEHRRRFLREALSAASVTHPFIAAIYEAGDADGTLFIVMEYVEGRTLRAHLGKGALPIAEAQRYAIEIAEGLAKAHHAGLVHRDLKPDNVIIANDGHAKILDFGLARVVERRDEMATLTFGGSQGAEVTTQGAILGTPAYMSPEQARGGPVDSRSDVFAFGSTVYEMLTGGAPFRRSTPADTLASILRDEPPPIDVSNPAVPVELSRIVRRCLHKRPEDRFNDTRDLAAALRDLQSVPAVPTSRQSIPTPARGPWGRNVALLAVAITAVALLALQPWQKVQKPDPDEPSVSEKPNWILVAEFEAPPDNPGLGPAARELVRASLEQSSVVMPIPLDQLKRGLAFAMKPDTTRVVGEVARELAVRAGARTYVEGRIDRIMRGYSIVVRVMDAESGNVVLSKSAVAANDEVFMSTLTQLGSELRTSLVGRGEAWDGSRERTFLAMTPMTPSFEAFQWWVRGSDLANGGDYQGSTAAYKRSVELDKDFARAWIALAINYFALGQHDSADNAFTQAARSSYRLNEAERLRLQELRASMVDCDPQAALSAVDLLLQIHPRHATFVNDRGVILSRLGRRDESIREYERACRLAPFGHPVAMSNLAYNILAAGDIERAEAVAARIGGGRGLRAQLHVALARGDWARAESLCAVLPMAMKELAEICIASIHCARGSIGSSRTTLERIVFAPDYADAEDVQFAYLGLHLLFTLYREPLNDSIPRTAMVNNNGLAMLALCSAMSGDRESATTYLQSLAVQPRQCDEKYALDKGLAEAWIAVGMGQFERIPALAQGMDMDRGNPWGGALPHRLVLAIAYERLGNLEEAVRYLEQLSSIIDLDDSDFWTRGIYLPYAYQRLAVLHARLEHLERAQESLERLTSAVTNSDPSLVAMIAEAQQAVATLQAAAH